MLHSVEDFDKCLTFTNLFSKEDYLLLHCRKQLQNIRTLPFSRNTTFKQRKTDTLEYTTTTQGHVKCEDGQSKLLVNNYRSVHHITTTH